MKTLIRSLLLTTVLGITAAACSETETTETLNKPLVTATTITSSTPPPTPTITFDTVPTEPLTIDRILANGEFSVLTAALDKAGLSNTLDQGIPYTLLAPTDSAFESANINVENLPDKGVLLELLSYHVLSQNLRVEEILFLNGEQAETLLAEKSVNISVDKSQTNENAVTTVPGNNAIIKINDALVLIPDYGFTDNNTVVHTIDALLTIPS